MKKWIAGIGMLLFFFSGKAQVSFSAETDTNRILIGEQVTLRLKAELPAAGNYQWPLFPDSVEGLEAVSLSPIDTTEREGLWTLQQEIHLTSFDSGYFAVPPLTFSTGGQMISSDAIAIAVFLPEVSEEQAYYDIKKPLEVSRNWWLILLWVTAIALAAALIVLAVLFILRRRKKPEVAPEMLLEPHEYALRELDKLEKEQLWQKGELKEYYSRLIDVLRIYLERQLNISAMESTADEIIEDLNRIVLPRELFEKIKKTLRLSAMVKFAKEQPDRTENEEAIQTVRNFIYTTKPKNIEKQPENVE